MTIPHSCPVAFDLAAATFTLEAWRKLAERYWRKVDKRGPDDCWPWTGHLISGYGRLYICGSGGKNIMTGAHRLGFFLHFGTLDPLLDVLHSCDFPPCQNWAHWRQGTHRENMDEMMHKGRRSRSLGEQSGRAKLTEVQVHTIRQRYIAGGISQRQLAREYKVTQPAILYVLSGQTWAHVGQA